MAWQDDYRAAMRRVLLREGGPITTRFPNWGMWMDWEAKQKADEHLKTCKIKTYGPLEEAEWSEWAGTFATHDNWKHGVEMHITCACGSLDRTFRYEESVATILNQLLEET